MFKLGSRSRAELVGVHPRLVAVVERAIKLTPQDFAVHDGLRTAEEQHRLYRRQASQRDGYRRKSEHQLQDTGFGHAVDNVPWINGRVRWEWPAIYPIAVAMRQAAIEEGLDLIWGGIWDRKICDLPDTAAGMEAEVRAYADRRRAIKKAAFLDGPHYEIASL